MGIRNFFDAIQELQQHTLNFSLALNQHFLPLIGKPAKKKAEMIIGKMQNKIPHFAK